MTPLLRQRNKELKDWLSSSTNSLKGVTTNIDDFVKQSNSLKSI
jgi:dynein heavy chain